MSLKKARVTWKVPATSGPYKTLSQLKQQLKKKKQILMFTVVYMDNSLGSLNVQSREEGLAAACARNGIFYS